MSRPFPEALPPDPKNAKAWEIRPTDPGGKPHTDVQHHIMQIPAAPTYEDFAIRNREMLRAAYTPRVDFHKVAAKYGVSVFSLETAETYRLHYIAHRTLQYSDAGMVRDSIAHTQTMPDPDERTVLYWGAEFLRDPRATLNLLVQNYVASMLTANSGPAYELLQQVVAPGEREEDNRQYMALEAMTSNLVDAAWKMMGCGKRKVPPFSRTIKLAQLLETLNVGDANANALTANAKGKEGSRDDMTAEEMEALGRVDKGWDGHMPNRGNGHGRWGRAVVEEPVLTENMAIKRLMRTRRATDAGVQLGRLERILSDQHVFEEVALVNKGTVLIDTSGSMSLSPEEVYNLAIQCPAVTVAVYCGCGEMGVIRIVCRRGKLLENQEDFHPQLGGNIIDGPALEWLALQETPRIWVSDGCVTGVDDMRRDNLDLEVHTLQVLHNIWRIPYLNDAATVIRAFNDPRKRRVYLEALYA